MLREASIIMEAEYMYKAVLLHTVSKTLHSSAQLFLQFYIEILEYCIHFNLMGNFPQEQHEAATVQDSIGFIPHNSPPG